MANVYDIRTAQRVVAKPPIRDSHHLPLPPSTKFNGCSGVAGFCVARIEQSEWPFVTELMNFRKIADTRLVSLKFVCLFVFGATAPSGSGPPHSGGF
jgi:hypothetical protein